MDPSDTRQPAIPKYFPIFFHLKMESFVPNTKVRFKECVRTYYLKHWCKPNKNMVTIDSSYVSKFLAMRNTSKSSSKGCQAQIVNGMWMGTYHCVERLSWSKFITSRLFRTMCYPIHSIALRFVIYEDTRYVTYCNMKITIEQNTWAPLFHQKWATHKKGDKEWRGIWGTCYVVSHPSNTFVARNLVTFPSSTCPLVVETMKRYNQDSIREEQVQNNYKIHLLTHHKFNIDTKNCHI